MGFDINKAKKDLEIIGKKLDVFIKKETELKFYKLQCFRVTQDNIHPMLLNTSDTKEAIYKDGLVYVGSNELYFESDADKALSEAVLRDGDEMYFYTSYPYFIVAKKNEYDKYQSIQKELQKLKKEKYSTHCKYANIENSIERYEFWEQYNIPFNFTVNIKPVKSGYSENSSGNACNNATVYHIVLSEDIKEGRLVRKTNEYLCSQPIWIPYSENEPYTDRETMPVITCKQCLNRIEKYKRLNCE